MIKGIYSLVILTLLADSTLALGEPKEESDLSFLVMGDWGGSDKPPYTTLREKTTAKGMDDVAKVTNARFALALGDNFYFDGVNDVTSHRFNDTFENVFTGSNLQSENYFRIISGNHDHNGNVSAQIAYSDISSRWYYPSLYYSFEEMYGTYKAMFVMLDTVIISGTSETSEGVPLTGDSYVLRVGGGAQSDAQIDFLNKTLASSDADIIIVAGHYPVWSVCEHGPTDTLLDKVKPLLEKYGVSAYLSGHDHCAEVIDDGTGVVYHGIGSANFNDASLAHKDNIPEGSLKFHAGKKELGGFARILLKADTGGMVVEHYDGDGTLTFTADEKAIRNL